MRESEKTQGLASACEPKLRPKKPYRKPTVRYEQVFETSALSCSKVQTTEANCRGNRKAS